MNGLSVIGKGFKPATHSDSAPSVSLLKPNIGSNSAKPSGEDKRKARIAKADKEFKRAVYKFSPEKGLDKISREVGKAEVNPGSGAEEIASNGLSFLVVIGTNAATLAKAAVDVAKARLPVEFDKMLDKAKTQLEEGNTKSQVGGTEPRVKIKIFSNMFKITYLPAILSLLISIFLIIVLIWGTIQWILSIINKYTGSNMSLPNITFDKKITQTVYSIFFVITSWFLMFYLVIDYFRNVGPELDIIQIGKQFIGALYILWPITVLIIGSGIAKAFYKISCNGNKPNVLSWAKIVEASTLNVVGMTILIIVFLLLKPIKYLYERYLHILVKKRFDRLTDIVRVTLKLMVIYILLRMVSIMIEDVISNKLVFFISKLNKNIEAPPVNCNAEEEEQKTKQSELAKILEEIYMIISGFIAIVIIIFIIIIQCPHPWVGSTSKLNATIGNVLLRLVDILTRFIVENKYGKIDCNTKKKGSGFFSSLTGSVGKGAEVPASDGTGATGYGSRFKETVAAYKAGAYKAGDKAQAESQKADTSTAEAYSAIFKGAPAPPSPALTSNSTATKLPPMERTMDDKVGASSIRQELQVLPAIPRRQAPILEQQQAIPPSTPPAIPAEIPAQGTTEKI